MKLSKLPKEYRELADKYEHFNKEDLSKGFLWSGTDEGYDFWEDVHFAKSADALPRLLKSPKNTHYHSEGIEPIEFIQSNSMQFAEGNVIKYVFRHSKKNGREDIEKAIHYLQLIIKRDYSDDK